MSRVIKPSLGELLDTRYRQHPRYRGCVGHWMMVEGAGTTIFDMSGNGDHGTLANAAETLWVSGKHGHAIENSTSSTGNRYVLCKARRFNNHMSVSAWIYWKSNTGSTQMICVNQASVNEIDFWFEIDRTANKLGILRSHLAVSVTGATDVSLNAWHHVAGTISGGTGAWVATLYLDGRQDGQATDTNNPTGTASNITYIADRPSAADDFLGIISDVRIYDRALTPGEVFSLYQDPFLEFEDQIDVTSFIAADVAFQPAWAVRATHIVEGAF